VCGHLTARYKNKGLVRTRSRAPHFREIDERERKKPSGFERTQPKIETTKPHRIPPTPVGGWFIPSLQGTDLFDEISGSATAIADWI
jgi:hypothetical protein